MRWLIQKRFNRKVKQILNSEIEKVIAYLKTKYLVNQKKVNFFTTKEYDLLKKECTYTEVKLSVMNISYRVKLYQNFYLIKKQRKMISYGF